jgi:hypothetical protein
MRRTLLICSRRRPLCSTGGSPHPRAARPPGARARIWGRRAGAQAHCAEHPPVGALLKQYEAYFSESWDWEEEEAAVHASTHWDKWQALIERAVSSGKKVDWVTRESKTIGHLARIEGKYFFVQFFKEGPRAGELASAWVPDQKQLRGILAAIKSR